MTAVVITKSNPFNNPVTGPAYNEFLKGGYRGRNSGAKPRPAFPDASPLEVLAGAKPSLDLNFAQTKSLVDRISGSNLITFTRASAGTFVNSAGLIETAAADVPRFTHDPVTGESLGLLVEEQRTNSIRNNTMVGAVAGTPGTLPTNWLYTVGSGGISRDIVGTGTENGINYIDIRFYGTTTNTNPIAIGIDSGTAATGQTWTASLYWKLVGGSLTGITGSTVGLIETTSGGSFVTGAFYAAANPSSSALSLQRVNATRTLSGGATVGLCSLVLNFNVTNSTAIDITLRIGLPQLEQGAFATSPILTSGATVTRSTDVASITGANFSSWYRQDKGTVFAGFYPQVAPFSAGRPVWILTDQTSSRIDFRCRPTSKAGMLVQDAGITVVDTAGTNNYTTGRNLSAAAYAINDFASSLNGETPAVDTLGSVPSGINLLQISAAGNIFGTISRLTFWPQRLPNSTLQNITL